MILEELTLHDFGVYGGKQQIRLAPAPNRPVVLIGALNGAGKTTILDALKVVLYGRHANCIDRNRGSYHDYLRSAIHRGARSGQGAGIELKFRYRLEGSEESYRIYRSWRDTGSAIKEEVQVFRNDKLDPVTTERCAEFVEQFIPNQISELFFFDGEKIESLADPERSSELLRVGVHALLGLDLVDDLSRSLLQVERRRKAKLATPADNDTLVLLDDELTEVQEHREQLTAKMAATQTEVDSAERGLSEAEIRLKAEGGDLYRRRNELNLKLAAERVSLGEIERQLHEHASGLSPLLLLPKIIDQLRQVATEEDQIQRDRLLCKMLEERDDKVISVLKNARVSLGAIKAMSAALQADRAMRSATIEGVSYLNIPSEDLGQYTTEFFSTLRRQVEELLARYVDAHEKIVALERDVAAVPDEAKIQDVLESIRTANERLISAKARLEVLVEERQVVERERVALERKRDEFLERVSEQQASDIISRRVIGHSARCRETLANFRKAMRGRHVERLERAITQCFQQLLRKKTLVQRIQIDPESFELRIRGGNDSLIATDRLSAGERQLLAVAVLWGLAIASGRQLPAVIDTPMGRLDSEHRKYLVEQYLPVASHQVILLSTDEEIDGGYYEKLRPAICSEYVVTYDDHTHSSTIQPGYFPQSRIAA